MIDEIIQFLADFYKEVLFAILLYFLFKIYNYIINKINICYVFCNKRKSNFLFIETISTYEYKKEKNKLIIILESERVLQANSSQAKYSIQSIASGISDIEQLKSSIEIKKNGILLSEEEGKYYIVCKTDVLKNNNQKSNIDIIFEKIQKGDEIIISYKEIIKNYTLGSKNTPNIETLGVKLMHDVKKFTLKVKGLNNIPIKIIKKEILNGYDVIKEPENIINTGSNYTWIYDKNPEKHDFCRIIFTLHKN